MHITQSAKAWQRSKSNYKTTFQLIPSSKLKDSDELKIKSQYHFCLSKNKKQVIRHGIFMFWFWMAIQIID